MSKSLTAFDLAGMTPKGLMDSNDTTREDCIAAIRENLHADDSDLDQDAENIYEYFFSKSKEFLILEFTDKDENGDWVLEQGSGVSLKITSLLEQNKNGNISFEKMRKEIDKQLSEIRDLFLANCIPSNDSELDKIKIENLKSINW